MIKKEEQERLINYLQSGSDIQNLSFQQIEMIAGSHISQTNTQHQSFKWNKTRISDVAEKAGFITANVKNENDIISFVRKTSNNTQSRAKNKMQNKGIINNLPADWTKNYKLVNYSVKFRPFDISKDDALSFLVYTTDYYLRLIDKHKNDSLLDGIKINKAINRKTIYLNSTDKYLLDPNNNYANNKETYIFKEMLFHSTNRIHGIDFLKYEKDLKKYFEQYDPIAFYKRTKNVNQMHPCKAEDGELYCLKNLFGKRKIDRAIKDFFFAARSVAKYLSEKINTLGKHRKENDLKKAIKDDFSKYIIADHIVDYYGLYEAFRKKIDKGFGKALTFDFLKEFDSKTFDLPKPDLHVRRVMVCLLHYDRSAMALFKDKVDKIQPESIKEIDGDNNCIQVYLELIKKANDAFNDKINKKHKKISNYILDKMIYIICSGDLYLQLETGNSSKTVSDTSFKKSYLNGIVDDSYKKYKPTNANIRKVLSIL